MIRCSQCGAENEETAKFCRNCGAPLRGDSSPTREEICKRRTILYKPLVDPSVVKLAGEQAKVKLFTRLGIFKPKPEQIQFVSLEKFYEPFIIVSGSYSIDYYREEVYTIDVAGDVKEIILFDRTIKLEPSEARGRERSQKITLLGEERVIYEDKAQLAFDKDGKEVKLDQIPPGPSEENPEKILAELGEKAELRMSPVEEVEILRSRILKRPQKMKRAISELFKVSERLLVYVPFYRAVYKHVESGDEKNLIINGVTGKIVS